MKKNVHTIVPTGRFHLLKGADKLTVYEFGTMTAVHKFCRICGVQSFYHPRSNPDGIAVTIACGPHHVPMCHLPLQPGRSLAGW